MASILFMPQCDNVPMQPVQLWAWGDKYLVTSLGILVAWGCLALGHLYMDHELGEIHKHSAVMRSARYSIFHEICTNLCGLMTPCGVTDLSQHWLSNGLVPNGTKPLPDPILIYHIGSCIIHLKAIALEIFMKVITNVRVIQFHQYPNFVPCK